MASSRCRGSLSNRKRHASRQGSTLWLVIGVLVFLAILAGGIAYFTLGGSGNTDENMIVENVKRDTFTHLVSDKGEVESSNNVEIKCLVKSQNSGGTEILWVVEEGKQVTKGEPLVKLDSSGLETQRDQQSINCNTSKAIKIEAESAYETALIAKTEYLEGTFKQEEQTFLSEIFVAEENLRRAELSVRSTERLAAKGLLTGLQLEADRFAVEKAVNELKLAQRKLSVLRDYTKQKMLKSLESDIASAKAKWDSEEQSYQLELQNLTKLEKQVAGCTIVAPQDGEVVHANRFSGRGNAEFVVEEGSKVREGQTIIRMPDKQHMQVKAKINESKITLIKPGMKVVVEIDAIRNRDSEKDKEQFLDGEVIHVNEYSEPTSFFSGNIKKYATIIQINNPPANLRPGMTAAVSIVIETRADALTVPVQAVTQQNNETFCLVKKNNVWETQRIAIGPTNQKQVVIESGLEEGQEVTMNPRRYPDLLILPKLGKKPEAEAKQENKRPTQPAPSSDKKKPSRDPSAIFAKLDTDSDGTISSAELQKIPAGFRQAISSADADGDGSIQRAEFLKAMKKRASSGGRPQATPSGAGS